MSGETPRSKPRGLITLVALAGGLVLLAGACGGGDDGDSASTTIPFGVRPTSEDMSAADAEEVDTAAQAAFASLAGKAPALYVGVWDPDKGFFTKAYGEAVTGTTPASIGDSLRIGSMTNTFTATVVLQLVREEELALNDSVEERLPELATQYPPLAAVTIEQLLSMKSGIPDYLQRPGGAIPAIVANPQRVWTPAELIGEGVKLGVAAPGTPGYSTTNYLVLQLFAEAATGTPLAELIATRITDPIELAGTALPPPENTALPAPAAHGYLNDGCVAEIAADGAPGLAPGTDVTDWNVSFAQGAGGMTSTLSDLGAWAETTMGNTSLSRELGNQRIETDALPTGLEYGLGIISFGDWLGHAGEAIGWESLGLHDPTSGVTFVAAANACNGTTEAFITLLDTLYPGTTE